MTFAIQAVMPNTAVASVSVETLITVVITDTLMQRVRRVSKLREPAVESDTIRSVTTVTCTACLRGTFGPPSP